MPLFLDHLYLVGKLTSSKIPGHKSVRILEILKLLFQQFLNLSSSQQDMSCPILGDLSNNRWSGGIILSPSFIRTCKPRRRCIRPLSGRLPAAQRCSTPNPASPAGKKLTWALAATSANFLYRGGTRLCRSRPGRASVRRSRPVGTFPVSLINSHHWQRNIFVEKNLSQDCAFVS